MNFEEELAKVSKKRKEQESIEHQKLSLEQEHKELCVDFKIMKREKEGLIEELRQSNKDIAKLQQEKLNTEIELEKYKKKYEQRPIKEVKVKVGVPQKYTERRLELLEKYLKPTKFFIFSLLFVGILIFLDVPSKTIKWYNNVSYTHNVRKHERQYNKWLAEKQNLNEEYQNAQDRYDSCANGIAFGCSKDYITGEVDPEDLAPRQAKIDQKADEIKELENNEPIKPQKNQ